MSDSRPVSPEAAPPRATTPEPKPQHVCGLMGYNPMLGDPQCPGCEYAEEVRRRATLASSPSGAGTPDLMAEAIRLIAELLAVGEWTNRQAESVTRRAEAWLLNVRLPASSPSEAGTPELRDLAERLIDDIDRSDQEAIGRCIDATLRLRAVASRADRTTYNETVNDARFRVDAHIATLTARAVEAERDAEALRARVRLLDRVIGEHHSASVMREEHDVCPVCMEHGGVDFFSDTAKLLRAARGDGATPT